MTFTITPLAGEQAIVAGTDIAGNIGQVVVSTSEWDGFKAAAAHNEAHDNFDDAVEAFFAPITEAAELLEASHYTPVDTLFTIVEDEGEEGSAAVAAVVHTISQDSAILRAIETDASAPRLQWLNESTLVVLAAS